METTDKQIVTRLAPSPTGFVHVGTLYIALFNYLYARQHHGKFLLRIEDTDRERYIEGAVEGLLRVLNTMGLDYDEGPVLENGLLSEKGEHGPYTQSNRLPIYLEHAKQLVDSGHAYYCFCTRERLDQVRSSQQLAKLPTKYDRTCTHLTSEEIANKLASGVSHVIRMKIPDGETRFHDEIRGFITIQNSEIDDQVLIKSDGFPTYHLAVVVDDNAMGVTHIIRGEEWISSVPKHLILYGWFEFAKPVYCHLPLILNSDKSKLSKRQGDVAVEDYLKKGYLPEALMNFVALLGFNPGGDREIYSLEELIQIFDVKKLNKSGAVFNIDKLNWMNGQYIRTYSDQELISKCEPYLSTLPEIDSALLERIVHIEKERLVVLSDITEKVTPHLKLPDYDASLLIWKKSDATDAKQQLQNMRELIETLSEETLSSVELIEKAVKEYIVSKELQNGNVLWPLRVSLSGSQQSANPFELLWILGKSESVSRITQALARLEP